MKGRLQKWIIIIATIIILPLIGVIYAQVNKDIAGNSTKIENIRVTMVTSKQVDDLKDSIMLAMETKDDTSVAEIKSIDDKFNIILKRIETLDTDIKNILGRLPPR